MGIFFYKFPLRFPIGNSFPYLRLSLRLLAGTWCLIAVILVYSYAGVLGSNMTITKLESIPKSLEELAVRGDLKISAEKGSLAADRMLVKGNY